MKRILRLAILVMNTLPPLVSLAVTTLVAGLGIYGLVVCSAALQSALRSDSAARELDQIADGIQDINGNLYHVLTLRGADIEGVGDSATDLKTLVADSARITNLLETWRDTRASAAQRPQVQDLITSLQRYAGAVAFVSRMLDVDFAAAVSFVRPFDQNYQAMMASLDLLLREQLSQQHTDANAALEIAATTMKVFEIVGVGAVLLTLAAAAKMGQTAIRSHRLTRQNDMLAEMTQIDALTGLGNRRYFDEMLARAWTECVARQAPLTLILFDIDHFKLFNDSQGHVAGDACLQTVAAAVMASSRDAQDRAARYGGEEFAIILCGSPLKAGRVVAERVRHAVIDCAVAHPAAGPPGIVTISLGVASLVPLASGSPAALIEAADKGLYQAKRSGRNRVGIATQNAARGVIQAVG